MAANINDKITSSSSGVRPVNTTVSSIRNSGSTTLACADLTGWPTSSAVHFVTYTIDGTGNITVGSQSDWKGIVSGSNITDLTLTGGSDNGNAIGDIVVCLPTARYGKELYDALSLGHEKDGSHKAFTESNIIPTAALQDSSITTAKINDEAVTNAKVSTGMPVQIVGTTYSAVATGTTAIPQDDTIPQITEGTEFMTQTITPKATTNKLLIEVSAFLTDSSANCAITGALFQDSTANALAASQQFMATGTGRVCIIIRYIMTASTTSPTTFRFRAGPDPSAGGTMTFNGISGSRFYGGAALSSITITEYKA